MDSYHISQYSLVRKGPELHTLPGLARCKTPTPEKLSLSSYTIISRVSEREISAESEELLPRKAEGKVESSLRECCASLGSRIPVKTHRVLEDEFQSSLKEKRVHDTVLKSKKIGLDYSLVLNGRPYWPPSEVFEELGSLFATTFAVEVGPIFLIIRLHVLPPKPWPFSIAGLPLMLATDWEENFWEDVFTGRGPKVLQEVDMRYRDNFDDQVLEQVIRYFAQAKIQITELYNFMGRWRVRLTSDSVDRRCLPSFIANTPAHYLMPSLKDAPDESALRMKTSHDMVSDDTDYTKTGDCILRPGIMLSSSRSDKLVNDQMLYDSFASSSSSSSSSSSGILVKNHSNEVFITVSTQCFSAEAGSNLIYHPNPQSGFPIGSIINSLPGIDISLAKLNPGMKYTNELFPRCTSAADTTPTAVHITGICEPNPPNLSPYDAVYTNTPCAGSTEGTVLAPGAIIPDLADQGKYIRHTYILLQHPFSTPAGEKYSSRGSPVINDDGKVVGLVRNEHRHETRSEALCVSACELEKAGYELVHGVYTF